MTQMNEGHEVYGNHEAEEWPCPCGRMTVNDCAGECGEPERVAYEAKDTGEGGARMHEFFGEPIHTYSRADALRDGVLVDVTELARESGFVFPVAVTASVWADIHDILERMQGLQDSTGRLWDLLTVLRYAIKARTDSSDGPELRFKFNMPTSAESEEPRLARYEAKSAIGPGDDGEPVLTIIGSDES